MTRLSAIAAIATLAAIGTASAATAATPAPSPVAVTSSAPAATAAPAASAVSDGVKVFQGRVALTVHNDTNQTMHVYMNGKTISGVVSEDVAPGQTLRAAGHTLASGQDVTGTITYANGTSVDFWGYNPDFGYPSVGFGHGSNWERFYVDETHTFTENGHNFSVTRHGDLDIGGGKDFHIHAR